MLSMSPQTPNGGQQGNPPIQYVTSPNSARSHSQNFKRPAPASSDEEDNGDGSARAGNRRNTVVKRACNECRQQKVRIQFGMVEGC